MDTQHLNAGCPRAGVIHANTPQTRHYTVVGNHLAQHEHLSLTAIGLAVHIQSLPAGSPVGIKELAACFPEGEIRIAAALRELEAHGYLARTRVRRSDGRITTRTVSYNQPPGETPRDPDPDPDPDPGPGPEKEPEPGPEPGPVRREAPDLPEGPAAELLLGLRRHDPRMLLSVRDVRHLVPGVEAWFARGAAPDAVRRTLLATLPDDLAHPAGLLSYRLARLLPPPLPTGPAVRRADPIQLCDTCEEVAFRAPEPGPCPHCRAAAGRTAA
ncbi:helix-turn-helix domain-containing protein [Streptomyces sp. NPDC058861]|uniref:helix-turn-helix domain-containing protein n=1 Tax=Streptomyces sp. NPDC058861 TaxID=3346653 RepID=UPI0036AB0B9D